MLQATVFSKLSYHYTEVSKDISPSKTVVMSTLINWLVRKKETTEEAKIYLESKVRDQLNERTVCKLIFC